MNSLAIIILLAVFGYITFIIIQKIYRTKKRNEEKEKLEFYFSENKVLKLDYDKLKIRLDSSELFNNFSYYEDTLNKALNNLIRYNELKEKYNNEIAEKIIQSKTWIGMTKEQLIESKGKPHDTEKEELKTINRENCYYYTANDKKKYDTFIIENNEIVKILEK